MVPSGSPLPLDRDLSSKWWQRFARSVFLPMLLAATIVVPRSLSMARQLNESYDDQYHLLRGLAVLQGEPAATFYNDPPLGEAIVALPLWVAGCRWPQAMPVNGAHLPPGASDVGELLKVNPLYGQPLSPETQLAVVAVWKAILYVPFVGLVFAWCRRLFGAPAGWMAATVATFEPTIASHIPLISLDVLGLEAIALACFCLWRCVRRPTLLRGVVLGVTVAVAMLVKHTAIILPGVVILTFAIDHVVTPRERRRPVRRVVNDVALVAIAAVVSIWPLTFFQAVKPTRVGPVVSTEYTERWGFVSDVVNPALRKPWPGGAYVGSVFAALQHGHEGHPGFLLGQFRTHGWWYYFPVVGSYKVPIGFAALLALGSVSIAWRRPTRDEWFLLLPALAWGAFLMSSSMSIGWRHFLVPYVFLLMLATRAATAGPRWLTAGAWLAVIAGAAHAVTYHPNYVGYLNRPVAAPWTKFTDSNLDWGQSVRQAGAWITREREAGRLRKPVAVYAFLPSEGMAPQRVLPDDVTVLTSQSPVPDSGVLVVSMVYLNGAYDQRYAFLRDRRPEAVIASSMAVYDLDEGRP